MFCIINGYRELIVILSALILAHYSHTANEENYVEDLKTLRMVVIIFRHGERNPDSSFPTDPNINYTWPGGFSALIPKGQLNLLNVGRKLRKRYSSCIPSNGIYHHNIIKVMSSEFERCIMSGESFLAGFMPPHESSNILPIAWQPIPIYVVPRNHDHYIFQLAPCPVYDVVYMSMKSPKSEFYNETYAQYADELEMLTNYTGKNFTTFLHIDGFYATLQIQQATGLKLPEWTNNIYPERLVEIVKTSSRLNTKTEWMKKMKGGPLLTQILDNMKRKKMKTLKPDRSIFIYFGHDITLKNVMNTIGILSQTGEIPGFGATLVFELHDNKFFGNDDFEIRIVYYKDGYAEVPINVNIPNCNEPCSLAYFTELMKPYIHRSIEDTCQKRYKSEF